MTATVHTGDCLAILPTIASESIDAIIADLPYGTTANDWDRAIDQAELWPAMWRVCRPEAPIILTATQPFSSSLVMQQMRTFRHEWIWQKEMGTGFLNAKIAPLRNHEAVLVFCRKSPRYNPQMMTGFEPYSVMKGRGTTNYSNYGQVRTNNDGERYPLTVISFDRDSEKIHPTQKPVALMRYLVDTYTDAGATILDPTCGSGSTGVACLLSHRHFIGVEIDQEMADKARHRIAAADPIGRQMTIGDF